MTKKNTQNKPYLPGEGYLKNEVVDFLNRQGYSATSEQLRKYEGDELFQPVICDNKYRVYTPQILSEIEKIYHLKLLGYTLNKIKKFLELKRKIKNNSILVTKQSGDGGYVQEISPEYKKTDVEYQRFVRDVEDYSKMCDEVERRSEEVAKTLKKARQVAGDDRKSIQSLL